MRQKQSIPLPTGIAGTQGSQQAQELVRNMIYSNGVLKRRPVVDNFDTLGEDNFCRGFGLFRNQETGDEELYGVFGQKFVRITIANPQATKPINAGDILIEEIGTVDDIADVRIVADFARACVMVVGGPAYIFDGSALQEIADPNYLPSVEVAVDDGRFVFCPEDGSPLFFSKLQSASDIQKRFFDAETKPDPNKSCFVRRGLLYALGSRSIEVLDYNPQTDNYRRINSDAQPIGFVSALTEYADSYCFIGQGENGGFEVYLYTTFAEKISNETISELLNREYDERELRNRTATHFIWEGTSIAVFSLPRHTIVFYGTGWAYWQTGVSNEEQGTWRVNDVQYCYGFYWTGDLLTGDLGNLVYDSKEFGEPVEGLVKTFVQLDPSTDFLCHRIYLTGTQGTSPESRVSISVSQTGQTYGPERYLNFGELGDYANEVAIGPPVGTFRRFMGIKLRFYGTNTINVDGITFD